MTGYFVSRWALVSPSSAQSQKCEKCGREFISPLNYRRHMRSHRKALHADNDELAKQRHAIGEFWAQLPLEKAFEILLVDASAVDEISGKKTQEAVRALLRMPAVSSSVQSYYRAGMLLENLRVNNHEVATAEALFSALDDASEKTFLIGGTSENVARYVHRKEEDRNAIASLAFLIEDNLVKAWKNDKDARAIVVQQALVEEEEAAQTKLKNKQEKKRKKKLRKKEKRAGLQEPVVTSASTATVSEDSDDQEDCADTQEPVENEQEPDHDEEEFTIAKPQRRRHHPEQVQANFPRYGIKYSRANRGGANGYSVWARRNNRTCDAFTTIDSEPKKEDHQQPKGEAPASAVPEDVKLHDDFLMSGELMIGSVRIPLHASPLESLRASSQRFDSLEKELLMPLRASDTEPDGSVVKAEAPLEEEPPVGSAPTDDASMEEIFRAFLADRWHKAVSDPNTVVIRAYPDAGEVAEATLSDEVEGGDPEAGPREELETDGPREGELGSLEAAVESSGVEEAVEESNGGGNVLSGTETQETKVDVKSGSYDKNKAGSRWKKSKASERRYLPKQ